MSDHKDSPRGHSGRLARVGRKHRLIVTTRNLEGLSEVKMHEITMHMECNSVDVLCIQETRRAKSDHFTTYNGYAVYLSGNSTGQREWAGVGFVIATAFVPYVMGFNPISNRIASLKFRVSGGCSVLFSVYAPHNLRPMIERVSFYDELEKYLSQSSSNGPKYVLGDLNARVGFCNPGEESVLGSYGFGREAIHKVERPNRDLLIEFCTATSMVVGNTFLPGPAEHKATYHEPHARPMECITENKFAMLDLALLPAQCVQRLISIYMQ